MAKPRKPKPTPKPQVQVSRLDLPLGPIPTKPGSRLKGAKK